jgi:hypothetical protein
MGMHDFGVLMVENFERRENYPGGNGFPPGL